MNGAPFKYFISLTINFYIVLEDDGQQEEGEEESALHRRYGNCALRYRRPRFSRLGQRSSNNSLLHVGRSSMIIHRRKPSMLNRVFHLRSTQNRCCPSSSNIQQPVPASATFNLPPAHQSTNQRSTDQVRYHILLSRNLFIFSTLKYMKYL